MAANLLGKLTGSASRDQNDYNEFKKSNSSDLENKTPENKSIVNLDYIVEKWIAYMWALTVKKSDKIEFDELDIEIEWKRCDIYQADAVFENKDVKGDLKTQTLFRTFFTNRTATEQEYSFKTERTTRQSCSYSFVKGFCREKGAEIRFQIPGDVCEIGGGMRSEHSVEMGKDETKEEEVKWGVDSMIKVKPFTKTSAELIINELQMERKFKAYMTLKGRLTVILSNKKDKSFVKSFSGDIVQILKTAVEKYWLKAEEATRIHFDKEKATVEFNGECRFRLGVEQHVNVFDEKA